MRSYRDYMDRQHVSPDLHSRLLALEEQQTAPVKHNGISWFPMAALAACLCLVVGLGWFALRHLPMGMGGNMTAADAAAPMETAPMEEEPAFGETMEESASESCGQYADEESISTDGSLMEEPAEAPAADIPAEEPAAEEDLGEGWEDMKQEQADSKRFWCPEGYTFVSVEEWPDTCILIWENEKGGRLTLQYIFTATETNRRGLADQGYPIYSAESGDWKNEDAAQPGKQGWGFVIEREGSLEIYTSSDVPELLPQLAEAMEGAAW